MQKLWRQIACTSWLCVRLGMQPDNQNHVVAMWSLGLTLSSIPIHVLDHLLTLLPITISHPRGCRIR